MDKTPSVGFIPFREAAVFIARNVRIRALLCRVARSPLRIVMSIYIPDSVKAHGRYARPPFIPFVCIEVKFFDLDRLSISSRVSVLCRWWVGCVETVRSSFHLVLGTKMSKLLCLIYCGFGKTSRGFVSASKCRSSDFDCLEACFL